MENKAKKCTMCGRVLSLDHFKRVGFAEDGHASHCKDCAKKKRREKLENKTEEGTIVREAKGGVIQNLQNSAIETSLKRLSLEVIAENC